MPVVINGTTGITNVNGSAAAPAETGTDTDTGIYYGTNTVGLATNGTSALFVDASQNVGVGTSSPAYKFDVQGGRSILSANSEAFALGLRYNTSTNGVWLGSPSANAFQISSFGGGAYLNIDSSGNVGIGTSAPSTYGRFGVVSGSAYFGVATDTYTSAVVGPRPANDGYSSLLLSYSAIGSYLSNYWKFDAAAGGFTIYQVANARFNINSSGEFGVGQAAAPTVRLTVASGSSFIFVGRDSTGVNDQIRIASNGNVTNVNGSYAAISDVKLKENIVDATPKLAALNQLRVVNYNLKGDTLKQIGLVAQEVEQVFPGLVEETTDRDTEGNDLGTVTKSVKYSVFVPMLIKAIQELKTQNDELRARVAALEGAK